MNVFVSLWRYWYFLIIISIYSLTGCAGFNRLVTDDFTQQLDTFSRQAISGCYQDEGIYSFWNKIYQFKYGKDDSYHITIDDKIILDFPGSKRLSVTLVSQNKIKHVITLTYRQKGDFLQINGKFKIIPIPFFWYYEDQKAAMGMDKNGCLYLKSRETSFTWLFVLAGSTCYFEEFQVEQCNPDMLSISLQRDSGSRTHAYRASMKLFNKKTTQ